MGCMTDIRTTSALRLLQAADEFRAGLAGEFSSVHGISVNEFLRLLHLQRSPKQRLARVELAKRMHVSASTVTRMAAPMEKIGLLSRDVDERDARIVFVVLTDTGAERLADALVTFAKRAGYLLDERWQGDDLVQLLSLRHTCRCRRTA